MCAVKRISQTCSGLAEASRFLRTTHDLLLLMVVAALGTYLAPRCIADGTLTLELPPSAAAIEARADARAQARARAASASAVSAAIAERLRGPLNSRGGMPRRGQAEPNRPGGRLGLLMHHALIYRRSSRNSPPLTNAMEGTYVAIEARKGGWYGVLMADGSIGWLPYTSVQMLNYQIDSTSAAHSPPPGFLPGYSDEGDVYPHTSTPYFYGDAQDLLREAYRYMGVPYVWGGNTVHGFDCSGFIKKVFAARGYNLPRLGSDQMAYGVPVPADQLQAGDRLYFGRRTDRVGVTHTGLYIGNGYFIHASAGKQSVAISHLSEPLFRRIYVCARR